MTFRPGGEWIVFGFDDECRLRSRRYAFGFLGDVARDLHSEAIASENGWGGEAAALFVSPHLTSSEILLSLSSSLAIKLPASLCKYMPSHYRGGWCEPLGKGFPPTR
jgi:hypothetical protein